MTLFLALLVVIAALAWVTLVGWSVTRLAVARLSPEETVAWSFAIGILLHVSLYATLLAAKASPGPKELFVGEAIVFGASLLAARRLRGRESFPIRFPTAGVLLATLAVGPYALDVLGSPLDSTDFLAIWGWKARLIFSSESIPSRLFHDPFTVWSHPVYPLFVPLCLASFALAPPPLRRESPFSPLPGNGSRHTPCDLRVSPPEGQPPGGDCWRSRGGALLSAHRAPGPVLPRSRWLLLW